MWRVSYTSILFILVFIFGISNVHGNNQVIVELEDSFQYEMVYIEGSGNFNEFDYINFEDIGDILTVEVVSITETEIIQTLKHQDLEYNHSTTIVPGTRDTSILQNGFVIGTDWDQAKAKLEEASFGTHSVSFNDTHMHYEASISGTTLPTHSISILDYNLFGVLEYFEWHARLSGDTTLHIIIERHGEFDDSTLVELSESENNSEGESLLSFNYVSIFFSVMIIRRIIMKFKSHYRSF